MSFQVLDTNMPTEEILGIMRDYQQSRDTICSNIHCHDVSSPFHFMISIHCSFICVSLIVPLNMYFNLYCLYIFFLFAY